MVNVGGMTPLELLAAMKRVVTQFNVEGMAVINLAPHRDPRGHSELLAAEAIDLALGGSSASAQE
jgi:arginase family enzyme